MKKIIKGSQTAWNKFIKLALKIATPTITAGVAAKTKNPQSAQITSNNLKPLTGGEIQSLTDMHGRGLRLRVIWNHFKYSYYNKKDNMKKCLKCKTNFSKPSFHKDISKKDCLHSHCIFCRKQIQKEHLTKNLEKKIYEKNRCKTDVNFRLIKNTRRRFHHALNGKLKSSSTKEILEIDINTYKSGWNFNLHRR